MKNRIHLFNGLKWASYDGLYSINLIIFGFEFTFLWRKYKRGERYA